MYPKSESLVAYFEEHSLAFVVVAENWLTTEREKEMKKSLAASNIGLIAKNRRQTGNRNPGGGIAIFYKTSKLKMEKEKGAFGKGEIVVARAKLRNNTRPMFILALYFQPKLIAAEVAANLEKLNETIL